ncbi:ABC transporter permease, partial [Thioclava sp. BHET1]
MFKRLRNSEAAKGYLMLSPTAIFSIVVMAAPLFAVVIFSFMTAGYLKIIWTPTLANYITVFTDPIYSALLE